MLKRMGRSLWQALPRRERRALALNVFGLVAPRPSRPKPDGLGPITVAGFLSLPTGLGQGARLMLQGLRDAGFTVHGADLTDALLQGRGPGLDPGPQGPGTLILHVNAPMFAWALWALGRRTVAQKRIIGYWAWELAKPPRGWELGYGLVHEIWTPSSFSAKALTRPGGPPVSVVPHLAAAPAPVERNRRALGLPEDAFVAACVFDCGSSIERKNPIASLRAFQRAFGDRPDRILILKAIRTNQGGRRWQELVDACRGAANIRIIDREMSPAELSGLVVASDCLISLHRSEGFGLVLAEAMTLGCPVIATGWSGNLDFMTPANCKLVGYSLVPARDEQDMYSVAGGEWAEPEIDQAAACLSELAEQPAERTQIAAAARDAVSGLLSQKPYSLHLSRFLFKPA